jgi:hypothetical protein
MSGDAFPQGRRAYRRIRPNRPGAGASFGRTKVSVLMPVYNGEPYLAEAIDSVLAQTLPDFELIAVDDASQDGSRAVLERFARADSRIRFVVNDRNLGTSGALNRGWQLARSPYIARMDADDVALPGRLARQVDFLDTRPPVAAVGGTAIMIDGNGRRVSCKPSPTSHRAIRSTLLRHNCLSHPSMTIRRSALEAVGGYRFRCAAEDYDLWLRLSERFQLATVPEPVILHRVHLGQVSVRSLEKVVTDGLLVRAAAHARLAGEGDPLVGVHDLTPDLVRELGVDETELRSAVEREAIVRAAILADLGHDEQARQLVEDATRRLGPRAGTAFDATRALLRADALLRSRRPIAAVAHVLVAFKRDARHALSLLMEWLGPRVPGAGFLRWT